MLILLDIGDTIVPATKIGKKIVINLRRKYKLPYKLLFQTIPLMWAPYRDTKHKDMMTRYVIPKKIADKIKKYGLNEKKLTNEIRTSFEKAIKDYVKTEEWKEIRAAIDYLRKNHKVVVLSDNPKWAKKIFMKYLGKFDGFVVSEEEGVAKPSKKLFELVRKRYKFKTKDVVVIGNSPYKEGVAKQYGYRVVLIYWRTPSARFVMGVEKIPKLTVENLKKINL
ncbi:hypothetical protein DRN75_03695 [Nanoarchaeota archaeon]|nr:MAG: hypothetical protein DRN75_03695 [Nanoarchaeota archaeon]